MQLVKQIGGSQRRSSSAGPELRAADVADDGSDGRRLVALHCKERERFLKGRGASRAASTQVELLHEMLKRSRQKVSLTKFGSLDVVANEVSELPSTPKWEDRDLSFHAPPAPEWATSRQHQPLEQPQALQQQLQTFDQQAFDQSQLVVEHTYQHVAPPPAWLLSQSQQEEYPWWDSHVQCQSYAQDLHRDLLVDYSQCMQMAQPAMQPLPSMWYSVAFIGGISVREAPCASAPGTGVTLPCGTVFATCESIHGMDQRTYLRLSDESGWVFDDSLLNPTDPSVVAMPVPVQADVH